VCNLVGGEEPSVGYSTGDFYLVFRAGVFLVR
jgi:hypothetical protein